jgi:chitin disaccharide deacetylase
MAKKFLIVNADDFGLSAGVNEGIIRAHEQGIVTSASLMVRWPAAAEAATLARSHPRLSVGLHVDLGEWTCEHDEWRQVYEVVRNDDAAAVAAEIARQFQSFDRIMGRAPTHLDSHQHVHNSEPVRAILLAEAKRRGVVLRSCDERVRYCGSFYGQSDKGYAYPDGISVAGLLTVLHQLPEGATELGCHPAAVADVDSMYRDERVTECATLCDARVRAAVAAEGIELRSFADFKAR